MAASETLKEVVLEAIYNTIPQYADSIPLFEDKKEKAGFIEQHCHIHLNEDYRIVMRFADLIGYGYDFGKKETAHSSYEKALEKIKKLSGGPGLETFVTEGIAKNCGWYITRL